MVVDASVWVSLETVEDSFHQASRYWLERYLRRRRTLLAPNLLLVEVAGAVARRTGLPQDGRDAAHRVAAAPGMRFLPLDDPRSESALVFAADLRLRGADAIYVAIAHESQVPLITWDQELLDRAAVVVPTYTPESVPFED